MLLQLYGWRRKLCAREESASDFASVQIVGEPATVGLPARLGAIETFWRNAGADHQVRSMTRRCLRRGWGPVAKERQLLARFPPACRDWGGPGPSARTP